LYWKALWEVLTRTFELIESKLTSNNKIFDSTIYSIEDYLYDYVHEPLEGIYVSEYHNYGEFLFNAFE